MAYRSSNPVLSWIAQYWFPVALVIVLLLTIPGMILFALNLLGLEGTVNQFLERNFSFTYSIPIPWWGALAVLLMPLLILLLYFLKLKRRALAVPSTYLWKKSIEDLHVNSFFQWLRQNILLLLALLAVVFMIFSIMGFRFHGKRGHGKHYILMIDSSASMAATDLDGGGTRLEWAKNEAIKEIQAAGDTDVGMVIEFNSAAEIKQSFTINKGFLISAVRSITQTQRPTRIDEALNLADSLANPSRSSEDKASQPPDVVPGKEREIVPAEGIATEVHLFSDGRFPDVTTFAPGNLSFLYHLAGKAGSEHTDNLALVTLDALRDEANPRLVTVFARVMNYKTEAQKATVQIEVWENGRFTGKVYEQTLALPQRLVPDKPEPDKKEGDKKEPAKKEPGKEVITNDTPGEAAARFELENLDERATVMVYAKLKGNKDKLPLDDEAWLIVGLVRRARVLIVSSGNEILEAFFKDDAIAQVAEVQFMKPDQLKTDEYLKLTRDDADESYDLVVFDRCGPEKEEEMPLANTFFIGHPPPPWKPNPKGEKSDDNYVVEPLKNPLIKGWDGRSAILRYLAALQEVGIEDAFRMKELPPRTPRLIESDANTTLMLSLSRQSYTDLVMTFPIITDKDEYNTNWWLKPSFPLFLRNVLYHLGNVSDAASEETVKPGQVKLLRPDANVRRVRVISPSGVAQDLTRSSRADTFSYAGTDQVGVYKVEWTKGERSFAVNLLDSEESNIDPRQEIDLGGEAKIVAGKEVRQQIELWKVILVIALLLVLIEWFIYNRRVYI